MRAGASNWTLSLIAIVVLALALGALVVGKR